MSVVIQGGVVRGEITTAPGMYPWIPIEAYHLGDGIGSTDLKTIGTKSPAKLKYDKENQKPGTPAQNVGQLFHTLALEPCEYDSRFALFHGELRTKEKKAEYAKLVETGKTVIRFKDLGNVCGMVEAVYDHPVANGYLNYNNSIREQSIYWIDERTGLLLKARPDCIVLDEELLMVIDIKKCQDASRYGFSRAIANYFYHQQAALYLEGASVVTGKRIHGFMWIAVEESEPHEIGIWIADREMIDRGRELMQWNIDKFAKCMETDEWPLLCEEAATIELPSWALGG